MVMASELRSVPEGATPGNLCQRRGLDSDPLSETDLAGNSQNTYIFFNGQRVARRDSAGALALIKLGNDWLAKNSWEQQTLCCAIV
jgi:hypothetical protein